MSTKAIVYMSLLLLIIIIIGGLVNKSIKWQIVVFGISIFRWYFFIDLNFDQHWASRSSIRRTAVAIIYFLLKRVSFIISKHVRLGKRRQNLLHLLLLLLIIIDGTNHLKIASSKPISGHRIRSISVWDFFLIHFFLLSKDFNQWAIRIACVRINLFRSNFLLSFPHKKKENLSKISSHSFFSGYYFLNPYELNWVAVLSVDLSIFIIVILCSLTFSFVLIEPKNGILFESNRLGFSSLLNSIPFEFCSILWLLLLHHLWPCGVFHIFHCILCQIQSAPHIGSDHKKHKIKQNEREEKKIIIKEMKWWTQSKL